MHVFEADTADAVWLSAARMLTDGRSRHQESRLGLSIEELHVAFAIRDSRQRWVTSRVPVMNPAFALAEVVWIMNGREDAAFLNFWNRKLPEFAGNTRNYPGAYGHRLRHRFGLDQIDRAVRALTADPDTRQVALQIWDAANDLPEDDGSSASADVPCNVVAMVKVRRGRLEWLQILRSNDLFLGVPYNFVQFTTMQEILAGWIGVEPGTYTQVSDSLHVYSRDVSAVAGSSPIEVPPTTGSVAYPREVSEPALGDLDWRARRMTEPGLRSGELEELVGAFDGPREFGAWLHILGAEAARRRGWDELGIGLAKESTNPLLTDLWQRWRMRTRYGAHASKAPVAERI